MFVQTTEINSTKIIYDKNKTEKYRTDFNNTCDCQNCRNYYKNVESNAELLDFLKLSTQKKFSLGIWAMTETL